MSNRFRHFAARAHDFAVIGFGRVEQQNGVPGRRRIEDDEALFTGVDFARKRTEYGDLLRAGRAQILFQHGTATGVEILAGARQNLFGVGRHFGLRIDAAD